MGLLEPFGLLFSLALIVVLVVRHINYGAALLIGTITLALLSSQGLQGLFQALSGALADPSTWDLVLITTMIPILAFFMRKTGMVDELVGSMKGLLSGRATVAFLPALMGSLPMPGGALLSAPLIEGEGRRLRLTGEEESFINVWFRHWNFFVYPLSSTLILASSLAGVALFTLIEVQFLPLLVYLILGYLFSLRRVEGGAKADRVEVGAGSAIRSISLSASPILLTVFLNVLGVPMVAALALGIVSVSVLRGTGFKGIVRLVRDGFDWRPGFAIVGVMCFRYMVKESGAVEAILPYVKVAGLPSVALLLLIAWIVGFTTAMPTAGVAMVFPLAATMAGPMDGILTSTLYLTIVFSYIVSPMHLCLVLTLEYYRSRLQRVYRRLIPAALVSYLASMGILWAIPL